MDQEERDKLLVKGRECGGCMACCKSLTIDTEGLIKRPNDPCPNLKKEGGCSIYPNWPKLCQEWFCAWRVMGNLDDNWRPDKSGILLEFARENFPAPFTNRTGFRFTILDKAKVFNNQEVAKFVLSQLRGGVPLILSYGIDTGQNPPTAFLNMAMHKAAMSGNLNEILNEMMKAINACEQQPKEMTRIKDDKMEYYQA